MTKTKFGSLMKTGFSWAGCSGTEYNLMSALQNKGYVVLYEDAPYYWGMINIKEKKIYTYTEGDTTQITSPTTKILKQEVESYVNFLKKSGHDNSTAQKIMEEL